MSYYGYTDAMYFEGIDAAMMAADGKRKIDQGQRLPNQEPTPRPFYCRNCGAERMGLVVPGGWYSLTRHDGQAFGKPHRLGMFCSLECLAGQLPRLQGIASDLGKGWTEAVDPYRLKPTADRYR